MKNITLSVDDDIMASVRRYASEDNSTVNTMVRDYLTTVTAREDRATRARARVAELSRRSTAELGAKTWTREDLHER